MPARPSTQGRPVAPPATVEDTAAERNVRVGVPFYLANFADYNATYGALGAVAGLMVWIWISVIILILGAELNAELEHQTAIDSTTGQPLPMGKRGAVVADTLGESVNETKGKMSVP
jgi:membrane protein